MPSIDVFILIYDIDIHENNRSPTMAYIDLYLSTDEITKEQSLYVKVILTHTPPFSRDMLSEDKQNFNYDITKVKVIFYLPNNQFIEIVRTKSQSTLIIQLFNKSTMLDALCFVLFNRPFRDIKKEQLVNTINQQDCELEVEFETSNKKYKVVRKYKTK